jgi:hypothetical protein
LQEIVKKAVEMKEYSFVECYLENVMSNLMVFLEKILLISSTPSQK